MTAILLVFLIIVSAVAGIALPDRPSVVMNRIRQRLVLAWITVTGVWMALVMFGMIPDTSTIAVGTLIHLSADGGKIALTAQLSVVSAGLLMCGLLLNDCGSSAGTTHPAGESCSSTDHSKPPHSATADRGSALTILAAGAVALLSDDLLIVSATWILLDTLLIQWCDRQLSRPDSSGGASSPAAVRAGAEPGTSTGRTAALTVLRLSGLALLAASLLTVSRYGTTSMQAVTGAVSGDTRIDADVVWQGIAVWFAIATSIRAAMFPLNVWAHPLTHLRPASALSVTAWSMLLPAVSVWLWLTPLLPAAPDSSLMLVTLGSLTIVVTGIICLADLRITRDMQGVLLLTSVTATALMYASSSAVTNAADDPRTVILPVLMLMSGAAALHILHLPHSSRFAHTAAGLFLIGGFAGISCLLDSFQTWRALQTDVLHGARSLPKGESPVSSDIVTAFWWAGCAAQLMTGAIVGKRLLRESAREQTRPEKVTAASGHQPAFSTHPAAAWSPLTIVFLGLFSLICISLVGSAATSAGPPVRDFPASLTLLSQLFPLNAGTVAGCLGATIVWLDSTTAISSRPIFRNVVNSFQQLSVSWFHAGRAVSAVSAAGNCAAAACLLTDRWSGQLRRSSWRQAGIRRVARAIRGIGDEGHDYPALAALLVLAGLLLALTGMSR